MKRLLDFEAAKIGKISYNSNSRSKKQAIQRKISGCADGKPAHLFTERKTVGLFR